MRSHAHWVSSLAILDRLGDVLGAHAVAALEVRDRSRDLEDAMMGTSRQREARHGVAQESPRIAMQR